MTHNDLNQIRGVVKEEINSSIEPVVKKLDILWEQTVELTENMAEVQETLAAHTETLAAHTTSLKMIVANTENNKDDIGKLNKRVSKLEDQAGIAPPPELTIVR